MRRTRARWWMSGSLIGLLVALCLAACGDGAKQAGQAPEPPAARGSAQVVQVLAENGSVPGWLYGRPAPNGVVLVPDTGRTHAVWQEVAQELAASGYRVLALDSGAVPPRVATVRAAGRFLERNGAREIVYIGEGAGGTAALLAAAADEARGAALLSPPSADLGDAGDAAALFRRIDGPVLIMSAAGDTDRAVAARRLYDAGGGQGTLALTRGASRGADLLRGAEGMEPLSLMRDFLREAFTERAA